MHSLLIDGTIYMYQKFNTESNQAYWHVPLSSHYTKNGFLCLLTEEELWWDRLSNYDLESNIKSQRKLAKYSFDMGPYTAYRLGFLITINREVVVFHYVPKIDLIFHTTVLYGKNMMIVGDYYQPIWKPITDTYMNLCQEFNISIDKKAFFHISKSIMGYDLEKAAAVITVEEVLNKLQK